MADSDRAERVAERVVGHLRRGMGIHAAIGKACDEYEFDTDRLCAFLILRLLAMSVEVQSVTRSDLLSHANPVMAYRNLRVTLEKQAIGVKP